MTGSSTRSLPNMPTKPFLGSCSATRRTTIRVWKVISTLFGSSVRHCVRTGRRGGALDRQGRGPAARRIRPVLPLRFAREVFLAAGPALLPQLHEALASQDRVVRSNAARACGAIGDKGSIPRLITALDLESGLSRESIVLALGESKAREALPRLYALFVDAKNSENSTRGVSLLPTPPPSRRGCSVRPSARSSRSARTRTRPSTPAARPAPSGSKGCSSCPPSWNRSERLGRKSRGIFTSSSRASPMAACGGTPPGSLRPAAPTDAAGNAKVLRAMLADPDAAVVVERISLMVLGDRSMQVPILAGLNAADRARRWLPPNAASCQRRPQAGLRPRGDRRGGQRSGQRPLRIHDVRELLERIPDKE